MQQLYINCIFTYFITFLKVSSFLINLEFLFIWDGNKKHLFIEKKFSIHNLFFELPEESLWPPLEILHATVVAGLAAQQHILFMHILI